MRKKITKIIFTFLVASTFLLFEGCQKDTAEVVPESIPVESENTEPEKLSAIPDGSIADVPEEVSDENIPIPEDDISVDNVPIWKATYQEVLALADERTYQGPGGFEEEITQILYSLYDMNMDGTPELILQAVGNPSCLFSYYTCEDTQGAVLLNEEWWNIRTSLFPVSAEGNLVLSTVVDTINALENIYTLTLNEDGTITTELMRENVFYEDDGLNMGPLTSMTSDDLSLLNEY